jgi:transposase
MAIITRTDRLDFEPEQGEAALVKADHPDQIKRLVQTQAAAR